MTAPEAAELEAVDSALAGRPVAPEHSEFAELALMLRDDRPAPTASWAADLDRRAQAGFPGRPRRRPRLRLPIRLTPASLGAGAVGMLLVVVVVGAAIIAPGDDSDGGAGTVALETEGDAAAGAEDGAAGAAGNDAAPEAAGDGAAGAQEQAAPEAAGRAQRLDRGEPGVLPAPPPPGGDAQTDGRRKRSVERSAAMTLAARPREIDGLAARVGRVAADLGGFVSASSISSTNGGTIDLRVPSARLDAAVERLSRLGRVRELTRQSRDITSSVVSARERLKDARTERKSLLRQLAEATTVNETESIRARLRIVSREIAAARSQLRNVNNRAQFADIGVTLVADRTPAESDDEGAWTPGEAFDDAGRVLVVAAGVAVIALALALPLAMLGGLAWLAQRGITRRRRDRALDMA